MSNPPKSLNDTAWEQLFVKYDILNRIDAQGLFEISAVQIPYFYGELLIIPHHYLVNLAALWLNWFVGLIVACPLPQHTKKGKKPSPGRKTT